MDALSERQYQYLADRQKELKDLLNTYQSYSVEQSHWRLRDDAFLSQKWRDKDIELSHNIESAYSTIRQLISNYTSFNRRIIRTRLAEQLGRLIDVGFKDENTRKSYCEQLLQAKETPFIVLCSALNLKEETVSDIAAENSINITDLPQKLKTTLEDVFLIQRRPWLKPDCASSEELRQEKRTNSTETLEDLAKELSSRYAPLRKTWEAETLIYSNSLGHGRDYPSQSDYDFFVRLVAQQIYKTKKWRLLYEKFAAFKFNTFNYMLDSPHCEDLWTIENSISNALINTHSLSVSLISEIATRTISALRHEASCRYLRHRNVPEKVRMTWPAQPTKADDNPISGTQIQIEWTLTLPKNFTELEQLALATNKQLESVSLNHFWRLKCCQKN